MVALDFPDWSDYDYAPVVQMLQSSARRTGLRETCPILVCWRTSYSFFSQSPFSYIWSPRIFRIPISLPFVRIGHATTHALTVPNAITSVRWTLMQRGAGFLSQNFVFCSITILSNTF